MHNVPLSLLSEHTRRAVFVKEHGICKKCHSVCNENDFEIMSSVAHTSEKAPDINHFYIVHHACKMNLKNDKKNLFKEIIKPYFALYIAGAITMLFGIMLFFKIEEFRMEFILTGFLIAAIGRHMWRLHNHQPLEFSKIRNIADIRKHKRTNLRLKKYGKDQNKLFRVIKFLIFIAASLLALVILGLILYYNNPAQIIESAVAF